MNQPINLNTLFTRLTNFKIEFTNDGYPTPTQVSNADLFFFVGSKRVELNTIMWDGQTDSVIIELNEEK